MHKAPFRILNLSPSSLQQQNQDMTPAGVLLIGEIFFLPEDEVGRKSGAGRGEQKPSRRRGLRAASALPGLRRWNGCAWSQPRLAFFKVAEYAPHL